VFENIKVFQGAYIASKRDKLLTTEMILQMIASKPGVARMKYRSFVENSLGEEIENPFKKVYGVSFKKDLSCSRKPVRKILDNRRKVNRRTGGCPRGKGAAHFLFLSSLSCRWDFC
jgi:hypothetical protein